MNLFQTNFYRIWLTKNYADSISQTSTHSIVRRKHWTDLGHSFNYYESLTSPILISAISEVTEEEYLEGITVTGMSPLGYIQ